MPFDRAKLELFVERIASCFVKERLDVHAVILQTLHLIYNAGVDMGRCRRLDLGADRVGAWLGIMREENPDSDETVHGSKQKEK